jgi:hypothetical protein
MIALHVGPVTVRHAWTSGEAVGTATSVKLGATYCSSSDPATESNAGSVNLGTGSHERRVEPGGPE